MKTNFVINSLLFLGIYFLFYQCRGNVERGDNKILDKKKDTEEELSLFASSQWTDAEGLGGGQIWLRDTAVAFLYSFQCVSEHKVLSKKKNVLTISWAKSYGCKYSTRIEEKYNELLGQDYNSVFCKIIVTSDSTLYVKYSDEFAPWVDSLNKESTSLNKGNTYPLSLKRWY